jgi:hypothetical protein
MDDLGVVRDGLERSLRELVEIARAETAERRITRDLEPAPAE